MTGEDNDQTFNFLKKLSVFLTLNFANLCRLKPHTT